MNSDFIDGVLVGGVLVLIFEFATGWYVGRKAKKTAVVVPPPQYDPADVALKHKPASEWHSLPGGRLELGATGFYITINPGEPAKVYQGFTPEHLRIVCGPDLASMKRYLEQEARERAEFDPPNGGWRA